MAIRLHVDRPLVADTEFDLPAAAARHAQVRRVQPGDPLSLFDGGGADWPAEVLAMGRGTVRVRVGSPVPVVLELARPVTLAFGMPAGERVDALVEKATELGVARLQPLHTGRSVLRLDGERMRRRRAHWQAIAVAACEQCGRACVPVVEPVRDFAEWLAPPAPGVLGWLLDPDREALAPAQARAGDAAVLALSGPEGGLTEAERRQALAAGFVAVRLGPRVLRADTAPLALLAWLAVGAA